MSKRVCGPLALACALLLPGCGDGERKSASAPPAAASAAPPATARPAPDPPPIAGVGELCAYGARKEPVMMAYKDATGAAWMGEIRARDAEAMKTKWLGAFDKRVPTVLATPRVEIYRQRVDDNCYDAARRVYYSCTKVLEADVRPVRGLARAVTMADARALALQLCEKRVGEIVAQTIEINQENRDIKCRVAEEAYCPPPPEAAPPAAAPPTPAKK
jgi:hypothetical protein